MRQGALLAAIGLVLVSPSCRSFDPETRVVQVERPTVQMTSGVTYEDLTRGNGRGAEPGDEILLDYVVSLDDGTRVDSTYDRGLPVPVRIGEAFVKGLDEGLLGIRNAGRRRIIVPPELAYGTEGVPGLVPRNATLIFEVHAIEVRPRSN